MNLPKNKQSRLLNPKKTLPLFLFPSFLRQMKNCVGLIFLLLICNVNITLPALVLLSVIGGFSSPTSSSLNKKNSTFSNLPFFFVYPKNIFQLRWYLFHLVPWRIKTTSPNSQSMNYSIRRYWDIMKR